MVRKDGPNAWIWMGKVLLAGVIAFIVLTLFSVFYHLRPVFLECEDGSTLSKYEPNAPYLGMTEGFGYGRTNNDGYIALRDYDEKTPIDVLVMGSSHMEAMQVPQRCCTANLLDEYLPENVVYNIGITGHKFSICLSNLASAVKKYSPRRYVIIEAGDIMLSPETVSEYLQDVKAPANVNTNSLYLMLRRNPYIHLLVNQMQFFHLIGQDEEERAMDQPRADDGLLSQALQKMSESVDPDHKGVKLIVVYHPETTLESDGSITFSTTPAQEDAFAALCEENGVLFLNMRDRFQTEYDESHVLPYGFFNTSVGTGHMNRQGHRMMAEELYALMKEEGL